MILRRKTVDLIEAAADVLVKHHPMTVRQIFYQLVAQHVIENDRGEYQRLSNALVKARKDGLIPWEWIEDRTRRPREPSMWQNLSDFLETVRQSYRRDIWTSQSTYVEVWLEKEALAGIFEPKTLAYGVTLVVGRGYNSWSALRDAAMRINNMGKPAKILYFGDFDPSGEDIPRALEEGLAFFGIYPEVIKVALTKDDVIVYNLPPDFTKRTDTRSRAFVEKYGDLAVELDALPLPVLRDKLQKAIEENLDMSALKSVWEIERYEVAQLATFLAKNEE